MASKAVHGDGNKGFIEYVDIKKEGKDPFAASAVSKPSSGVEEEIKKTNDEPKPEVVKEPKVDYVSNSLDKKEEEPKGSKQDSSTKKEEESGDIELSKAEVVDKKENHKEEPEVNPYYFLAQKLKKDGFLPEDLEVNDKIDASSVYSAYVERMKTSAAPAIQDQVLNELRQQGINQEHLTYAQLIASGVDPSLLSDVAVYKRYAEIKDDVDDDVKIKAIEAMYKDRGFSEREISKIVHGAKEDEEVDAFFESSKQHFGAKYQAVIQQESRRVEQIRAEQQMREEQARQHLANMLRERKFLDDTFTTAQAKEIEEAISNPTEIVEIDGNKYQATEFQKFLYEFENSLEHRLYLFKKYKYRNQEHQDLKNKAKEEAEDELLSAYEKAVLKDMQSDRNKQVKDALDKSKKSNITTIEF